MKYNQAKAVLGQHLATGISHGALQRLGTNWASFTQITGQTMAMEGMFAFFWKRLYRAAVDGEATSVCKHHFLVAAG